MSEKTLDILGVGVATVDDLMTVESFPKGNDKMPVLDFERQGGGLTATALFAACRLGRRCRMILSLGGNELSGFLRTELTRAGMELHDTGNANDPDIRPVHSVVMIEKNTGERAIIWRRTERCEPVVGPSEMAMLESTKCLFVDSVFAGEVLGLAARARETGIPVVGDFEWMSEGVAELAGLTNHLILPLAFAKELTGAGTPEEAARALASAPGRTLACVTDSERGCWYVAREESGEVRHQPAFKIGKVVDATGCGDVFHGAYAAFLVAGYPPGERIRRASAAAALKAGKTGAQKGSPTRAELDAFLDEASTG